MSKQSLFHHCREENQLVEVKVDDLNILLPSSREIAIGTQFLNGCTCVVILGTTAIILAHISPIPGSFRDWEQASYEDRTEASRTHHQEYLRAIEAQVQQYDEYFPKSSTGWGIFAMDSERRTLQSVVYQVEAHLTKLGFDQEKAFYQEVDADTVKSPKGELVAIRRSTGLALYLEKKQLWPRPASLPPMRPPVQGLVPQQQRSGSGLTVASSSRATTTNAPYLTRPISIGDDRGALPRTIPAGLTNSQIITRLRDAVTACLGSAGLPKHEIERILLHYCNFHRQTDSANAVLVFNRAAMDTLVFKGIPKETAKRLLSRAVAGGKNTDDDEEGEEEEEEDDDNDDNSNE